MKGLGVGMALAILIDATIVRALLVPATMRLMGHWNWWAPGPLLRLWERIGLGDLEGHGPPQPRPEPTGMVPALAIAAAAPNGAGAASPVVGAASPATATVMRPVAAPAAADRTMVAQAVAPGQLAYLVARTVDGSGSTHQLTEAGATIGRAADNTIVLPDQLASGHHARIERAPDGSFVVHDLGSTNGTFVGEERVDGSAVLAEGAELKVGGTTFTLKVVAPAAPLEAAPRDSLVAPTVMTRRMRLTDLLVVVEGDEPGKVYNLEGDTISIGRDPRNQIVLNDVRLSAFHVRLQRGLDGGLLIEDRGSTNGTFLNGVLLEDPQPMMENDLIQVGHTTLQLQRLV